MTCSCSCPDVMDALTSKFLDAPQVGVGQSGGVVSVKWSSWWVRIGCAVPAILLLVGAGVVYLKGIEVEDLSSATPTTDADRPLMVALGDSFISGEGAERYLKGTGSTDNLCHRANTAYPYLVAQSLDHRLVTAACSGATTADILDDGQHRNSPSDVLGGTKQLDVLDGSTLHDDPDDIDLLVLSIGGNDAGFGDIVMTCLDERSCQRHDRDWMRRLEGISPRLEATYEAIAAKVPDARRIVMTYPQTMVPIRCAPGLSRAEIRWVNKRFLPRLATIITRRATNAGFEVVDNTDAFVGARICEDGELTDGRAANVFSLAQVKGRSALDPAAITRGSFHPTPLGHTLLAAQLLHQLGSVSESPDPCTTDCPPVPSPDPPVPPGPSPFPLGTECAGDQLDTDKVVSVDGDLRTIDLAAAPGSRYCFRDWEDTWHSGRVGGDGQAEVSTRSIRNGNAISVEVLTRESSGSWTRTVLTLAATDSTGKATILDRYLFLVVGVVVGSILLLLLPWIMWWWERRRRQVTRTQVTNVVTDTDASLTR